MIEVANGTVILERTKFNLEKPRTIVSAGIRLVDNTDRNHVAIVIYVDGVPCVFEAWKRVICTELKHWMRPENSYEFVPPAPDFDADFAKNTAMDMMGWTEYNYLGTLFFQLIYQLSGRTIWLGPSGDAANKKVQCAQFVGMLLKKANPWLLSPKDYKPKQ
jgi:hypothetical protein